MSTKKKIFIFILAIEAIAVTGLIIFLFYINSDTVKVNRQLELAQHYLLEEDYEQAIAAYEIVIQIDPRNEDAYLGLAQAYTESGDLQKAIEVLEEGYENTEAEKLQEEKEAYVIELAQIEAAISAKAQPAEAQPEDTPTEVHTTNTQPEDTPIETKAAASPVIEEQVSEASEEAEKEAQSEIKTDENTGVTQVSYDADGSYIVYIYDGQRNLIKEEHYASNRNLDYYYVNSYDEQGNLIKKEYYDSDRNNPEGNYSISIYDRQGNLIRFELYSNGNLDYYEINSYNEQGNLIKEEHYASNGNLNYINTYDEQGNLIKEENYDYSNGNLNYINTYDEQGNLIKEERYDSNGNLTDTYNY